jgi:hypothetical protein
MHSTPVVNRPPGHCHRVRAAIRSAIVLAPIALLVAACGSSPHNSPSASSSRSDASPAQARQAAVRFAGCMRSHGVSNFPDSSAPDGGPKWNFDNIPGVNPSSPSFQAAYTACKHLLPGGGPNAALQAQRQRQQRAGLLAFAQCMRRHGITRFPDPNSQGELTPQMATAAGIDLHAPSVAADARACVPASHGTITAADVARATSGQ